MSELNDNHSKETLLGNTITELRQIVKDLSLPSFVATQLAYWLYKTNIKSLNEMSNISKKARGILAENYDLGIVAPIKEQASLDGTRKYLYPVNQNKFIETAYIPEERRNTLCISSQVGCKMGCLFCATGKQGFQANLTPGQIVNQLRSLPERDQVSNIVFMGMGEPFDNLDSVMKAQEILTSEYGFSLSIRRVTVSTIGIIPAMDIYLHQSKCNLAISMHSPFDEERRQLMPIQHVYPIKEVIAAVQRANLDKYRKVSIEYIVFDGLNDTQRHVKELARLLNKIRCKINLIRFHPVPDVPLPPTDEDRMMLFQKALNNKGIITTIRASRGIDIDAACGLLSTKALMKQNITDF